MLIYVNFDETELAKEEQAEDIDGTDHQEDTVADEDEEGEAGLEQVYTGGEELFVVLDVGMEDGSGRDGCLHQTDRQQPSGHLGVPCTQGIGGLSVCKID